MTLKSSYFLNNTVGDWTAQRTIYYLKQKKIKTFTTKISIHEYNTPDFMLDKHLYNFDHNLIKWHNFDQTRSSFYLFTKSLNIIHKINNNQNIEYEYTIFYPNCLQVKNTIGDIECIEYIYNINTNFKISISFIKQQHKYIAIVFTSDIKIIS